MESFDLIDSANAEYIERLYQQYQKDPRSLEDEWVAFFSGFEIGLGRPASSVIPAIKGNGKPGEVPLNKGIYALVHVYRENGHLIANLDPLGHNRKSHPLLELSEFGLTPNDLNSKLGNGGFLGFKDGTLRELIEKLRVTYCQTLGVQYTDISDKNQRNWLEERMEPILNHPHFPREHCAHILKLIVQAEEFEQFLHTKYIGQKRFSIEGGEALLPLLDTIVEAGSELGVDEVVMGMAHRGRLNVLAHILGKPYETFFCEFEGSALVAAPEGDGDVKYHLGYSCDRISGHGRKMHISLCPNPSHLELVDPVIEGIVWAKQERKNDSERSRVIPVQIHGEAAFTGQGIVYETLSLSELKGYGTGGTIHIIINNQLGYTAIPSQTRYTTYPTDISKMIQAPVFHVNADDPQAVVHAARMAIEFRQQFKTDVLIDLICYRRYGHNEADDPTYTQPVMYKKIQEHSTVTQIYSNRLLEEEVLDQNEVEEIRAEVKDRLDKAFEADREIPPNKRVMSFGGLWQGITRAGDNWDTETAVPQEILKQVAAKATRIPPNFNVHRKLKRFMQSRMNMVEGKEPMDWGCAEMLAIGSLLLQGIPVRLTGQDVERGTFSHRHAVWHDVETDECYVPLKHLDENQAPLTILNTMLSELAVLGFEYGVSSADPNRLVVWEAQFGDFVNGAQMVIDQFITSSESKWQRMSGIVLALPHGYEGQGPEHSSGRLERFLTLCAEKNIQVSYPTTPAQLFHLYRQQVLRKFRKPLVVMSPKSLLRNPRSFSTMIDLTKGRFQRIMPSPSTTNPLDIQRLLLCTGKVYYDLEEERENRNSQDVSIVRMEQLYPFPEKELESLIAQYKNLREVFWIQEEPQNMGAWRFMREHLTPILSEICMLTYIGRDEASSPATGSYKAHKIEQEEIVNQAFDLQTTQCHVAFSQSEKAAV